jgi:hypothetical protein
VWPTVEPQARIGRLRFRENARDYSELQQRFVMQVISLVERAR